MLNNVHHVTPATIPSPLPLLSYLFHTYTPTYIPYMQYGIIIDAGSSHTDAIFYKWVVPRYKDTGNIKEIGHCRNSR